MHEVIATNAEAIAIAAGYQYGQIVIRKLHSSRDSKCPAVQGVHAVGIDEAGEV
jgi:hypothetical protein